MAIIKKFAPFQNLSNFEVFENDTLPNSEYFKITELKETFTGGKNGFLIEGSEYLKETSEVKIEILDVEGNPIYFEPGKGAPEYYEGNSTLVSIHVYDDTPIGIGKITILGELKNFIGQDEVSTPIPLDWDGIYNVKWEREIQVNKNIANETIVRFYKRPIVTISEIVKPIFSKTINDTTDTGNVNGFPLQPPLGQNLSEWRAGTNYLLQRTSGTWDADVDENIISIPSLNYNSTIIEVLNDTDVIVDIPHTDTNGNVAKFSSEAFSVSYQDIENETIGETSITGSFAKIDIKQLKTFVGDVARVKIFRKSRNAVGDFAFVQEAKLESQELLRDVTTTTDTEVFYGKLTNDNISNYWVSSSNDHPISVDSSVLFKAVHIDYNNDSGSVQQFITSRSIEVSNDVEYTLNFKTLLSGSIDDTNKSVRAFFSSSEFTQDFLTVSGSAIYQSKQDISQNIISTNTGSANLVFEVQGDDWYISNISLRNAQDTSFSPDEFTIIQDIPRKTATETFDFRFEFYDVNNNFIPVDVLATKEFDGGNDFPTSGKLFTFESDRNAFRFSSGSIGNPPFQQIQFKTSQQNLTGSVTFASSAFDEDGNYIDPSSYGGDYPGGLTSITPAGSIITIANFSGSEADVVVGSIIYTASLDGLEEFETVYRLEDGDNAPQLIVTSNANQFIYEPTTLSPKPSGQSITVRAQRKNLASLVTPIEVNSGSNNPGLTFIDTVNGIDTYTISATEFSESFSANSFDEVTYEFTGSDVFGNEQSDEITLSKVVNFDAVSLVLSNESTAFPAKSTGEVLGDLTPSSGSVQMFIGSNQITHDDELGGRTKNTFNITSSIGDNVTPTDTTPNTANYSISAFETAKDSGSLTLTIDYLAGDNSTTQSFQKIVSYTKSKKAVPTVLTKISPSTQTINSSSLGYDSPQTMEVIVQEGGDEYTFDSSNLSGGGDVLAQKFNINSLFVDSGSITNSDNILTFGSLTSSFNSIIGSASLDYVDSEGTYVTGKKVRFDLAVSKIGVDGINGASGSNARAVSLSSTKYAIVYDGDGNLFPANQDFTLSGSAQNFNTPEFQFLSGGAEIHPFSTTSEVIISSSGYPQRGDTSLFEVRVREQGGSDIGVFDNIDVFAVQSGSDAFTVFLTNEAHVFSATSESVVTSDLEDGAFETRFFRGADQYNFGTSGKTYSISATSSSIELIQSTNSNQRVFTPSSITADSGSATITVTDNNTGQTFDKKYSFTLSKEGLVGERGADGINGASGSNARAVSLSSTKYAVVYDGDGTLFPTSQPFTLSGSQQNFSNPQFQFLQNGSDISNGFGSVSELVIPTDTGSLPTAGGANLYEVRVRETGGSWDDFNVLDNIDVFGVQSGSDAFTVFLTNEAHVFSATSESVVTSNLSDGSFETRFFRGADQYNLGTTGKTYSISATSSSIELTQSTNSNQKLFTPTSITADSGSATIVVTDNNTGQTFDKQYSFTLSKEGLVGERGADGANGASGSNAKVVSLSSTKYAVVYDGDGVLFPTSQPFTLSGSAQNFTSPEFQFLEDGSQIQAFGVDTNVIIPTDAGSLPTAGASRLYEVRVRESGGSYEGVFDNIDVFGVQSGSDSFTTFLTNEAHVFSANSDGVVTSTLADGSFETRFFRGAEQYNFGTSGKTYSVSATSSSIELEQSTNSNQRKFTPTAASADNGSASITLTDNNTGQTFEKTYTFSKSKKGAPAIVIFATPQTQTVTSGSVEGIGTPSVVEVIVNEGGSSNYTHTTGTVTANKFKITGVTNATNNNDGTITPSTPTSASPVKGVITLSYTNSESTAFTSKEIGFSVGVAGVGDIGIQGNPGDVGKKSASNMVHYQVSSASKPSTPTATAYNFATNTFTGLTTNWGTGSATYAAGNSNKYWYSTYAVTETTSEGGTGVPTFSEAAQAIGFSGLVSFTATDTIGDGTDNLSFGVAGSTLINGDNISTGRIISTNYSTGSGNGFTAAGTEFNLDEGQFASEKFFIDGGDAAFSGSISAEDGSIGGLFINNSQLIGGQGPIGKAGGKPFFTLDSGIGASWEYDGNDTVTGLFLAGITGSQGVNFNHNTYDNPFFTGSDFTGSAIAITDVGDDENVYIRLGNRNAYIKLTSEGSAGNGSLIVSSSNFNITPGGDVQATNFQMTSGSLSITGNGSSANIDSQGTLTAVNANIDGTITANSGQIGGFTIDSSSLYSNGSTFARLQAGTTPSLIFYENAETASVKLTAEETLTAIDIGASPPDLNGSSYTSITAGGSDTAFSNTLSTVSTSQSGTSVTTIPTGNLRFPSSGNVPSEYDGITATFTGTLTPQSVGYFVKIQAEAYSSNISFASVNSTIGIRVKKSGGSIVASYETSINASQAGFGAVFNLEDTFSSKTFSMNFDMESGENYYFEVFSKNGTGVAGASGTGISINLCEWRQPRVGSIAVSMRGGENTPPFSELTRGGLQVVGNAAAGADKRAVKIPAASGVDTLQVTGSISATGDITAFNTSDERLKENIVTIVNPIEKIKQVKGVEFTWKPGFEKVHMFGTGSDIGVIAQDVQKILPQIVSENIFHNYLGVQYDKLTPLLVESVKELSKKIEELENKLKDKE